MLYYLGKGTDFKKEDCKEYKTLEGVLKAAAKDESLVVWDENGQVVDSQTEAAVAGNEDEQEIAGEDTETAENGSNESEAENEPSESENGQNEANTEPEDEENSEEESENEDGQQDAQEVIVPQGTMRVTVVCDGELNIRRSPAWSNENICGRAMRGRSYYVKAIHTVDGKKMVQTIDDLYLSGMSEHVQFEQL